MKINAQLRHLGIYVADIDVMQRYFSEVFGMVVTDRGISPQYQKPILFLSGDPASHHQLVLLGGRVLADGPSTVNQMSFKVDGLPELRELHERLAKAHDAPIRPIDHGNALSLYTLDPEGNGIEVYMDTPWHVAQPHARKLDMSLSDAQIMATTKAAVLADSSYSERQPWMERLAKEMQ